MKKKNCQIFYLKKRVLFPGTTVTVSIPNSKISTIIEKNSKIIAYPIKSFLDIILYRKKTAILTEIFKINKNKNKTTLTLKVIKRVKILKIKKFFIADYIEINEKIKKDELQLKNLLIKKAQELIFLIDVEESNKLIYLLQYITELRQLTDFIANYFFLDFNKRYKLLNNSDPVSRAEILLLKMQQSIKKLQKGN